MTSFRVYRNTRFDNPRKWTDPPELWIRLEDGAARAWIVMPVTANSGAELRALAEEADKNWAEYSASLRDDEVPA